LATTLLTITTLFGWRSSGVVIAKFSAQASQVVEHLTISSAAFDRHVLGSLPTLIFHLAAVEPHGAVMVARSPKPVKTGYTSL
jgi:hypothetical protein